MKKHLIPWKIVTFILVFIIIITGIIYNKLSKPSDWNTVQVVNLKEGNLTLTIDPRMELLSVIQLLSDYNQTYSLLTQFDFKYKESVIERFEKYKEHSAVIMFNKMSMEGYSYHVPPATMLYFPEAINDIKQVPVELTERSMGEDVLNEFYNELINFAEETNFIEFYNSQEKFYSDILKQCEESIKGEDYIGDIEGYYGENANGYNIILTSLFHSGGFGHQVINENNTYDIYSIQGPTGVKNDIPIFGDRETFRYLVWHEFSHSFVNPITTDSIEEANKSQELIIPIQDIMSRKAYPSWESCLNEHIIRAVTARLTKLKLGDEAYQNALNNEIAEGFIYTETIAKQLLIYENNRDTYETFERFYPEILKALEDYTD